MGQKVSPISLRLGINRDWDSRWFSKKNYADFLIEDTNIRKYIRENLKNAGISKIEIERKANNVDITLHTNRPGIVIGRGGTGVEELRVELEKRTGKQVRINVQEVVKSELNASLVAENVASQIVKRVSYRRVMKQAVTRSMAKGAKGIKICCSGRLGGAEIARTGWYKEGRIPLHTLRANIDYGFTTAKTTYGNVGIKVWIYKGDILPQVKVKEEVKNATDAKTSEVQETPQG